MSRTNHTQGALLAVLAVLMPFAALAARQPEEHSECPARPPPPPIGLPPSLALREVLVKANLEDAEEHLAAAGITSGDDLFGKQEAFRHRYVPSALRQIFPPVFLLRNEKGVDSVAVSRQQD